MENVLTGLRWLHILAGAIGLVLFWVPIFSRKGSPVHKRFGQGFLWCVNIIGVTALTSVSLHLGVAAMQDQPLWATPKFGLLVFLGYLGITVLTGAWYMRHVLIHKRDPAALRRPLAWALMALAFVSSTVLILIALTIPGTVKIILLSLSPIGYLTTFNMQRHLRRPDREPKAWFYEHMAQGVGLGIAFHTAFLVFGARSVFAHWLTGNWAVLPWVAPVVVGIALSYWWEQRYRRADQARQQAMAGQALPI
ncbi:hypothetical protein HPT27_14690 [Permianibacter sp. IMCC34836]|uniref:hypothetical protein n=1 Tax=Permianibacter fluminis TaxID=2738515 RepID=UPI001554D8F7|nr:hypothetical protein [Permianibacter fluminis]NQD38272.1 hypothetical protein [Permianibacter fluminis]